MKESTKKPGMDIKEAEDIMTEPIYEGMMETLIVEVSKGNIAHRLSKHGSPLPSWVYEQAEKNVEAFFTMLERDANKEREREI